MMNEHAAQRALDQRVDPVAQAREYQRMLLELVGDRDPMAVQEQLVPELRALVEAAGSDLRVRPEPGEWSVQELLGHLLDAELVTAARYRWILAQDEPALIGYDQDLWVSRLGHQDGDPEQLLSVLATLQRFNLELWRNMPEADRARVGIHAERGPESIELIFSLIAGHGLFHTAQIRRTLEQVASAR